MAKSLVVTYEGADFAFGLTKIERSKIYGSRRRMAIDTQERLCVRAALSLAGTTVITSGMTGQGHFAPDGRWVSRGEMVGLDATGVVGVTRLSWRVLKSSASTRRSARASEAQNGSRSSEVRVH